MTTITITLTPDQVNDQFSQVSYSVSGNQATYTEVMNALIAVIDYLITDRQKQIENEQQKSQETNLQLGEPTSNGEPGTASTNMHQPGSEFDDQADYGPVF